MSGASSCVCSGKPLNALIAAFAARAKVSVAERVAAGSTVKFKELQLTAYLVKALAEGRKSAFDARYRSLDHHLPECPCSPRFRPRTDVVDRASGGGIH